MKMTRRDFVFKTLIAGAVIGGSGLMRVAVPNIAEASETGRNNTLVIYFSWSGNTKGIATEIHQKVGGDLVRLELVKPYSRNYNTCLDEAKRDQEQDVRPELKTRIPGMDKYDVVYLGYPNWWATIPMPIATLLETYDFSGKTIAPFCSHGGGRLGQSVTDIAKLAPKAKITEALSIHYSGGGSLSQDIDDWLRDIGPGE